jgi:hypothetical protein
MQLNFVKETFCHLVAYFLKGKAHCSVMAQQTLLFDSDAMMQQQESCGSGVFHTIWCEADSDATMEHVTVHRTHQQSDCKKKCILWDLPRG